MNPSENFNRVTGLNQNPLLGPGFTTENVPALVQRAIAPASTVEKKGFRRERNKTNTVVIANAAPEELAKERNLLAKGAQRTYQEKYNRLNEGIIIGSLISSLDSRTFRTQNGYVNVNVSTVPSSDAKKGITSDIGTVNSPLLGTIDANSLCENCGQINCPGHEGTIIYEDNPIINPLYISQLPDVLRCVCWSCGKLLIDKDTYMDKGFHKLPRAQRLKILAESSKNVTCMANPISNNLGGIVTCSRNAELDVSSLKEEGVLKRLESGKGKKRRDKSSDIFPVEDIYNILDKISDEDAARMGFQGTHPRNMINTAQIVTPRSARPPSIVGNKAYADPLTHYLRQIVQTSFRSGRSDRSLYQDTKVLYLDSSSKKASTKKILSIAPRIQGKEAIPRQNLQGKRNDKSARGVANGAAANKIDEASIPIKWMKNITKPLRVTELNYDYAMQLIANRQVKKFRDSNNVVRNFRYDNPPKIVIGDTLYRYYTAGDYAMCNRQPTLHKPSCMAYKMKGESHNTVGLSLCVTQAMNADFDGDDFNKWFIQKPDVEAEMEYIISSKRNIMSTENSKPMIACFMNTITGSYLITGHGRNILVDDILREEILELLPSPPNQEDLEKRLRQFNVDKNSGYGFYSILFPPKFYYENKGVKIVDGVLVAGQIDKSHISTVSRSIVQDIHKRFGEESAYNFINNVIILVGKWMVEYGFSVSITDFFVLERDENGQLYNKNEKFLKDEMLKIELRLDAVGEKSEDPIAEQARERSINAIVNSARKIGMDLANQTLKKDNQIAIMTEKGAGTKGAFANIGQMMGAVAQQYYKGERFKETLSGGTRTIPTFYMNDDDPAARGFIRSSFFQGLTPTELFHLQEGAREGILDTALKTAETGEMQRLMTKSFENIIVANDGSIRNTSGALFSTVYGGCGYAVAEQLNVDKTGRNETASFIDLDDIVSELNGAYGYINESVAMKIPEFGTDSEPEEFDRPVFEELPPVNSHPLTKFEKSRIIGARAMQLYNNAPPIIDPGDEVDSLKIAEKEYLTGKLDICVLRRYHGNRIERIYPTLDNIT